MNPQLQLMLQQAIQAFQVGSFERADSILKKILLVTPKNLPALHILGLTKASQEQYREAAEFLGRAARLNPNDASIQYNLAKALADFGADKESVHHYKKATELAPNNPEVWFGYGKSLSTLGVYEDAIVTLTKAVNIQPNYSEAFFYLGYNLNHLKRYDEAISSYEKALALNPTLEGAWSNKGLILSELKRYDEAISSYEEAITLMPDYYQAWYNKGLVLNELKRYAEAILSFDMSLRVKPEFEQAWYNKGLSLNELKRYDEAIASYEKAINIKSDVDYLSGSYLFTKVLSGNWDSLTKELNKISEDIYKGKRVITPFNFLVIKDDPALNLKVAKIWAGHRFSSNISLPDISKKKGKKIRIGYFSADFHNHATAYLIAELFEQHDKSKFECVAFSFGPNVEDEMRNRLIRSVDQFIDVHEKSDREVALLSRGLEVDIAVDLKGYTRDSRTGIFAYRAAPIQVNYLGYPGTMGVDYIDYIIADQILIPSLSQKYYSERIAYLPNSYQVNDRKRIIADRQFSRQELGLPERGFVFCCFNNNYKITPTMLDRWIRILKGVEGSILWLFEDNAWAAENLKKEVERRGVDFTRIVFAKRMPLQEHLARHRQANLFLDTLPCNAHTTASDALWTGLPVLTLMGESFASRVAASLLQAIELPELIAATPEEYEALAIEFGTNPQKLDTIKQRLLDKQLSAPLFDTTLFAKHLEAAYTQMMERYWADLPPENLYV